MSLTQENIDEINTTLDLVGSVRLTTADINYLNALDTTIENQCDMYAVTQAVILDRYKDNPNNGSASLSKIKRLANSQDCELSEEKPVEREAIIPILGGGL